MFDQRSIAQGVSRWTGLGVTLPDDLAAAITIFETLFYIEVGHQPVFDIEAVTESNAEDKIREFADQLVVADSSGGGQSILERAKKRAVDSSARVVNIKGREAIPEVISQLATEFDQHAADYIAAVSKLPDDLTAESLVAAGPEAVVTYGQAQQEAAYLDKISSWVASTGSLTGGEMDVTLRILRPGSLEELSKLDEAHRTGASPTVLAINPIFFRAAKLGVEFGINTLPEAAQLRQKLTAQALSAAARAR